MCENGSPNGGGAFQPFLTLSVNKEHSIMPLLGQASGQWLESSSALRILHAGVRNTVGVLTTDAFTQTNPPIVTTPASTLLT